MLTKTDLARVKHYLRRYRVAVKKDKSRLISLFREIIMWYLARAEAAPKDIGSTSKELSILDAEQ